MHTLKPKAFTLIEIVASITIFAVIVVGIAFALRNTNRLSEKLLTRQESVLSAQAALDRLTRELRLAYHNNLRDVNLFFVGRELSTGPEVTFSFLDSPIETLFVRRTPGVKIASYALEATDNGSFDLIRSETPIYMFDRIQDSQSRIVARGILEWKMQYYDYRNDQWVDRWDSQGTITGGYFPTAVKLRIKAVDPRLPQSEWKDRSLVFQTAINLLNEYRLRR